MPRILDNILEELNESLKENLNDVEGYSNLGDQVQFYRECTLQEKDGITFPIQKTGNGKADIVSIDNDYSLQIYHRLLSADNEDSPLLGYGANSYRVRNYNCLLVCFGTLRWLKNPTHASTSDFCQYVVRSMPTGMGEGETILRTIENTNMLDVLSVEFEGISLKHLSVVNVAFTIEYTIKQRSDCGLPTNTPIVTLNNLVAVVGNNAIVT